MTRTQDGSALAAWISAFALCALFGCTSPEEQKAPPPPTKRVTLQIVHGPDLAPLLNQARSHLDAQRITLGDGSVLSLELTPEPDVTAARKLARGDLKIDAWIGPSFLIPYINERVRGLGAKQTECAPLFSSPMVLAVRKRDAPTIVPTGDEISLTELSVRKAAAAQAARGVLRNTIYVSHELPDVAGLGFAALAQFALSAEKIEQVSASPAATDLWKRTSDFESIIGQYDSIAGAQRLASAPTRAGLIPAVVTSEQQVIAYNQSPGGSGQPATALYFSDGVFFVDYQLCTSDAAWVTSAKRVGIRLLTNYFNSGEFQHFSTSAGFRLSQISPFPQAMNADSLGVRVIAPPAITRKNLSGFVETLLAKWPEIAHPSATVFVLDSSAVMLGEAFEQARDQIRRLVLARRPSDRSALVTLSFGHKVEVPFGQDAQTFADAILKLAPMGGAALVDGIQGSFRILHDAELQQLRRSIVVFTAGVDSNSANSIDDLKDALASDPDVRIHVLVIKGLRSLPADPSYPLKKLGKNDQINYREVDVGSMELEFEELKKAL